MHSFPKHEYPNGDVAPEGQHTEVASFVSRQMFPVAHTSLVVQALPFCTHKILVHLPVEQRVPDEQSASTRQVGTRVAACWRAVAAVAAVAAAAGNQAQPGQQHSSNGNFKATQASSRLHHDSVRMFC